MNTVVVDAGVLVCGFMADEPYMDEARLLANAFGQGRVMLIAPSLLPHEFTNSILKAVRRDRLSLCEALDIMGQFDGLSLLLYPVDVLHAFGLAQQYGRTAYDAAYLALAEQEGVPLITADERLYNAVRKALPWVVWLPEWRSRISLGQPEEPQETEDE